MGCDGRPGASDMREPEADRMCCVMWVRLVCELDRFIAVDGMGIAEAL